MLAWVTDGLIAPGVRAEFGRTAPAALTMMPPAGSVETGGALTGTFEGAVVLGELTAVGRGSDAAGRPVIALVDVCAAVPAASLVVVGAVPTSAHPPVRRTSRPTTDHAAMFRGVWRCSIRWSLLLRPGSSHACGHGQPRPECPSCPKKGESSRSAPPRWRERGFEGDVYGHVSTKDTRSAVQRLWAAMGW